MHVSVELLQWFGLGLIGIVGVQALTFAASSVSRLRSLKRQQRLASEILEEQLRTARAHRVIREESSLSWNGWRKFQVVRKSKECADVVSLYFAPHDRKKIPSFYPGQFLTFQVRIPGMPQGVIRCYSISDAPKEKYYRISVKRVPASKPGLKAGLVSNYFHDHLQEGEIIDLKPPGGSFYLDLASRTPVVLIGGGIGVTPLLSMVNALTQRGPLNRETWLFLGVKHGEENFRRQHLLKLASDHENLHIRFCYSNPLPNEKEGTDFHHGCRVSADLLKSVLPSNNYDYYLCGPPPFMESITRGLREWGVPDAAVHFEAFGPASVSVKPSAAAVNAESAAVAKMLKITFSRSNKELFWTPDVANLLELAEKNGVTLQSGCRSGSCGTCVTAVKSGKVVYQKPPSFQPEGGSCLTCIGAPESELVLDA